MADRPSAFEYGEYALSTRVFFLRSFDFSSVRIRTPLYDHPDTSAVKRDARKSETQRRARACATFTVVTRVIVVCDGERAPSGGFGRSSSAVAPESN